MLNPKLSSQEQLFISFSEAKPFRHISIDDFLVPTLAQGLLEQFPSFDPERAKNEMGQIGGKATREDVRALGPAYEAADNFFSSPEFINFLSKITGIPGLIYDPEYFGGGTHENRHGQELDVHVDFNYHRSTKLHRRLNLIVYLNPEWDESWGGNIEIHSDPRNSDQNEVTQFAPLLNRCVLFETNEYSWHGFSRIQLPADKRHLSRKSFTVYYYTKSRPENEIVPPHNTFYIQRPLPKDLKVGEPLTQEGYQIIKGLIAKRDVWLKFYQDLELRLNSEILGLRHMTSELQGIVKPPVLGYTSALVGAEGYCPDGWINQAFKGSFIAHREIQRITFRIGVASELPENTILEVTIDKASPLQVTLKRGSKMEFSISVSIPAGSTFCIEISGSNYFCPKTAGLNADDRKLLCTLESIITEH